MCITNVITILYSHQSIVVGYGYVSLFELSVGLGGEYMEINRGAMPDGQSGLPYDKGHLGMCVIATQNCAEILWHQGYDMFDMKLHNEKLPRLFKVQNGLLRVSQVVVVLCHGVEIQLPLTSWGIMS